MWPPPSGTFSPPPAEGRETRICVYISRVLLCIPRYQSNSPCLAQEKLFLVFFLFSIVLHSDSQDILDGFEGLRAHFSHVLLCFPSMSTQENEYMLVRFSLLYFRDTHWNWFEKHISKNTQGNVPPELFLLYAWLESVNWSPLLHLKNIIKVIARLLCRRSY